MHPLIGVLADIPTSELEKNIFYLTEKYFTASNPQLKQQIILVADDYREELYKRRQAELENSLKAKNKELDKIIHIS